MLTFGLVILRKLLLQYMINHLSYGAFAVWRRRIEEIIAVKSLPGLLIRSRNNAEIANSISH